MTQRTYPYAKLMRFTKAQWQAIQKHCTQKQVSSTLFIRRAIERELQRSK